MSGIDRIAADYLKQMWAKDGSRINDSNPNIDQQDLGTDCSEEVFGTLEDVSKVLIDDDSLFTGAGDSSVWTDTGVANQIDDINELNTIFSAVGVDLSADEQKLLFAMIDANGDGVLTKEEYEFMMDGDNGITGFSMWRAFAFQDESTKNEVKENQASIYTGTVNLSKYESDEKYKKLVNSLLNDEQIKDLESGKLVKFDFQEGISNEKIKEIAEEILMSNGDLSISDYKDILNEENFKFLETILEDAIEGGIDARVGSEVYTEIGEIIGDGTYSDSEKTGVKDFLVGLLGEENFDMTDEKFEEFINGLPTDGNPESVKAYLDANAGFLTEEQKQEFLEKAPVDGLYNDAAKTRVADFLNYSLGLNLSENDMETFKALLPESKDGYGDFLRGIANTYIEGEEITSLDVQMWKNQKIGISSDVSSLGLTGDVNDPTNVTAKQEYVAYLVDTFDLSLTPEQIQKFEIYGGSVSELVSKLDKDGDGRINQADVDSYIEENL